MASSIRNELAQRASSIDADTLADPEGDGLSAEVIVASALAANDQHRFPVALRWAERAAALGLGGELGALAQLQKGVAAVHLGAARTALDTCQSGLDMLPADADPFLRAELTAQLGVCERRLGMPARAARIDDRIEVAVHDQGAGLPPGGLDRWTEAFTQADPSPTREREGLGLGLSLARQHAERMGGDLVATTDLSGAAVALVWPFRPA